jgi:cell division septal protein FtsQ
MLGNFIYSEELENPQYRYGAINENSNPQKIEKSIRRFLLLAVIFVTLGLIWVFCISPCMVPVKIDIKSFSGMSKAEVLNIADIAGSAPYIAINASEAEWLLSRHYLVESVKVVKRFPDRLSIFLEPRREAAVLLASIDGRSQSVFFDRYGVAFRTGGGLRDASLSPMPVVSGIFSSNHPIRLGMRLPSAYVPLFSRISAISDEDSKIWQAISEIEVVKKSNGTFDLVLYPIRYMTKLRMGSDISKESIYYALLMIDAYRQFGNDIPDEIDVRSGLGVLKTKEARFGE